MRRRTIFVASAAGLALLAAACILSPVAAAGGFCDAVLQRDHARVREMVDFERLVPDLRARTRRRVLAAMQTDDELHHNPLAGLGLAILPDTAERRAQAQASADGLFVLLATGEPPLTPIEAAHPPAPGERRRVQRSLRLKGLNRFELAVRRVDAPASRETLLEFTRRGPVSWRLTRMAPPA